MGPVLLFFIIISICHNIQVNSAGANEEKCERTGSPVILAKTITPGVQSNAYCNIVLEGYAEKNKVFMSCQNGIRNYFLNNLETDGTVRSYAMECIGKLGTENWKRCTDVITYLNSDKLCWDMTSATNLIIKLDKKHFLTDENLNKIDMKLKEYEKLVKIVDSCTGTLDDKFENTLGVISYYRKNKELISNKKDDDSQICGGDQILGIFNFYRRRKIYEYLTKSNGEKNEKQSSTPTNIGLNYDLLEAECEGKHRIWQRLMDNYDTKVLGDENRDELLDLYKTICFENDDSSLKEHLKKTKLDVLADTVKFISFKRLKDLTTTGRKLFRDEGWLTLDKPESHWHVDFLYSKISVNEKIDQKSVDFIADIIIWGFSQTEYEDYMKILTNKYQFNEKECPKNILEAVMVKTSNEGIDDKKDYWRKRNKNSFNQHLKILLDTFFKSTNLPVLGKCDAFSTYITDIEKIFYSSKWSEVQLNDLIRTGFHTGLNLKTVRNCLKLSLDVENAVEKFNSEIQEGKANYDGLPKQHELDTFRRYLLGDKSKAESNCDATDKKIDLNKYDDLMTLYKDVTKFSLFFRK